MLKSSDRKFYVSVMQYFFDVTNTEYADYTNMLSQLADNSATENTSHAFWVLARCFEVLKEQGIPPLQTCIEQKDMLRELIIGEQSAQEGEYYTPERWCQKGREYLKAQLGSLWSEINVWDCACGTGNLVRTADIDQSRLFLSTLLPEDVNLVKSQFPEATVFQMNALMGLDYDEVNSMFLNQLPEKLQRVFLEDKPLLLYINPPYRATGNEPTDVYYHMMSSGLSCSANDLQTQFIYRLCLLADTYKLSNFYVGLFGTPTWLSSLKQTPFREHVFDRFKFLSGFMFDGAEFPLVNETIVGNLFFTVWKKDFSDKDNKIILDILERTGDTICRTGSQLVRPPAERLTDWCKPADVMRYVGCPAQSSGFNFRTVLSREPDNTLAHMMTENMCKMAVRSTAILPYPISGNTYIPITAENYWRCIFSHSIRSSLIGFDFTESTQVLQAPDTSLEGYSQLLADCLAFTIFDLRTYNFSYRDLKICDIDWNRNNPFFPLGITDCQAAITDPVLLEDMQKHPSNNQITLEAINWAAPLMSNEAKELMKFGISYLVSTFNKRGAYNYKNWTSAYDAGLTQLRTGIPELWTAEDNETYMRLISQLRTNIRSAAYTYGVLNSKEV